MSAPEALNMKLLANHRLDGVGNMGEGIAIQKTNDGRRILWMAHWGGTRNFTSVDVTDPKNPKMVCKVDLPHTAMRSNSLDVTGNLMAVAYQTARFNLGPAGVDLFDITIPENPKLISFFDCGGPHSMGAHFVWFVDGEFLHISAGAPDFTPSHANDHQFYRCIDVRNPSKPVEVGRWWYPGTKLGEPNPPPRKPRYDTGYRAHNCAVYPERPDRVYIGYIDGGAVILDISDKSKPKQVAGWTTNPPSDGMTHTVVPLFERDLYVISEETTRDNSVDWPKYTWIVDARDEANLVSVSALPVPKPELFRDRGGRYGAHNLHENRPGASLKSETLVFGTYFNGGVRVHDISNASAPREVAYYIPETPVGSRSGAAQVNDVYVDENGVVYVMEREVGGLYVLELQL